MPEVFTRRASCGLRSPMAAARKFQCMPDLRDGLLGMGLLHPQPHAVQQEAQKPGRADTRTCLTSPVHACMRSTNASGLPLGSSSVSCRRRPPDRRVARCTTWFTPFSRMMRASESLSCTRAEREHHPGYATRPDADTASTSPAPYLGSRHDPGITARLDRLHACACTACRGAPARRTQGTRSLPLASSARTGRPARAACLVPGVRMAHTCTSQYTKGPASRASRDIRTSDAMTAPGCLARAEGGSALCGLRVGPASCAAAACCGGAASPLSQQ